MADNPLPTKPAVLDPSAPAFEMPTEKTNPPQTNGTSTAKRPEPAPKSPTTAASTAGAKAESTSEAKLTPAQLKKQKAAEKAARRAEKVAGREADTQSPQQSTQPGLGAAGKPQERRPSVGSKVVSSEASTHHKRTPSQSTPSKALPIRPTQTNAAPLTPAVVKDEKRLSMIAHLRPYSETPLLPAASREIHPAVISLALQLHNYTICGANARCIALLLAFKKVISSYTTPPGTALSRHLTTHLSHQISYVNQARQLGISQGNAIRWLKKLISTLDIDVSESDAKSFLNDAIDQFIREKITLAGEVIARDACSRIEDGDVIMTYGKSSVVEKTLLAAHEQGRRFRVIVADSRPLYEGRNMARGLLRAGIETSYTLIGGLGDVVEGVTKCVLGAAGMLGNGRLSSRAGTAVVAMMVKECGVGGGRKVPVMVLCESVKFTGKVALEAVMMNELGDPDALVEVHPSSTITSVAPPPVAEKGKGGKKGGKKDEEEEEERKVGLEGWRDQQGLHLLNLMYDITPAEYVDIVVSELGSLPPSAVPEVNRLHGGEE